MTCNIKIAIDAMGGDLGLEATVPGAAIALAQHPDVELILVGDEAQISAALKKHNLANHDRVHIQPATEVVAMDEPPAQALRTKKDSSIRVAINLVESGAAGACVSSGNTGALMATARFVLKMIPGIDRPAIIYAMPSYDYKKGCVGSVHVLDLGANIDCTPSHLLQFAVMGAVLAESAHATAEPRVALLNIGAEQIKGHEGVKQADALIREYGQLNYIGYVEGDDIFANKADVIVCDGFTGNVALKTTEGAVKLIGHIIRTNFMKSIWGKIGSLIAWPVLKRVRNDLDVRRYNGATFLGLQGIVIKSHGGADALGFATAITEAIKEVQKDVPTLIHERVADQMAEATSDGD